MTDGDADLKPATCSPLAALTKANFERLWVGRPEVSSLATVESLLQEYNSTHGSAHSCLSGALCRLKSGDRYVVRFIDGLASAQQVASSATPVRGAIAGRPLLLVQPNALVIGEFVPSSVSPFSEEIWRQAGEAEVQHCIARMAKQQEGRATTVYQVARAAHCLVCARQWLHALQNPTTSPHAGKAPPAQGTPSSAPNLPALKQHLPELVSMLDDADEINALAATLECADGAPVGDLPVEDIPSGPSARSAGSPSGAAALPEAVAAAMPASEGRTAADVQPPPAPAPAVLPVEKATPLVMNDALHPENGATAAAGPLPPTAAAQKAGAGLDSTQTGDLPAAAAHQEGILQPDGKFEPRTEGAQGLAAGEDAGGKAAMASLHPGAETSRTEEGHVTEPSVRTAPSPGVAAAPSGAQREAGGSQLTDDVDTDALPPPPELILLDPDDPMDEEEEEEAATPALPITQPRDSHIETTRPGPDTAADPQQQKKADPQAGKAEAVATQRGEAELVETAPAALMAKQAATALRAPLSIPSGLQQGTSGQGNGSRSKPSAERERARRAPIHWHAQQSLPEDKALLTVPAAGPEPKAVPRGAATAGASSTAANQRAGQQLAPPPEMRIKQEDLPPPLQFQITIQGQAARGHAGAGASKGPPGTNTRETNKPSKGPPDDALLSPTRAGPKPPAKQAALPSARAPGHAAAKGGGASSQRLPSSGGHTAGAATNAHTADHHTKKQPAPTPKPLVRVVPGAAASRADGGDTARLRPTKPTPPPASAVAAPPTAVVYGDQVQVASGRRKQLWRRNPLNHAPSPSNGVLSEAAQAQQQAAGGVPPATWVRSVHSLDDVQLTGVILLTPSRPELPPATQAGGLGAWFDALHTASTEPPPSEVDIDPCARLLSPAFEDLTPCAVDPAFAEYGPFSAPRVLVRVRCTTLPVGARALPTDRQLEQERRTVLLDFGAKHAREDNAARQEVARARATDHDLDREEGRRQADDVDYDMDVRYGARITFTTAGGGQTPGSEARRQDNAPRDQGRARGAGYDAEYGSSDGGRGKRAAPESSADRVDDRNQRRRVGDRGDHPSDRTQGGTSPATNPRDSRSEGGSEGAGEDARVRRTALAGLVWRASKPGMDRRSVDYCRMWDPTWCFEHTILTYLQRNGEQSMSQLDAAMPMPRQLRGRGGSSDSGFADFVISRPHMFDVSDRQGAARVEVRGRAAALLDWKRHALNTLATAPNHRLTLRRLYRDVPFPSDTPSDELDLCRTDPQGYLIRRLNDCAWVVTYPPGAKGERAAETTLELRGFDTRGLRGAPRFSQVCRKWIESRSNQGDGCAFGDRCINAHGAERNFRPTLSLYTNRSHQRAPRGRRPGGGARGGDK